MQELHKNSATNSNTRTPSPARAQWDRYRALLADEILPAAIVDLGAVDHNVDTLLAPVRASGKTLRIASKSLRCVSLLEYIAARGGDTIRGLMTYTAHETLHLAKHGFDDLLLAYPTLRHRELDALVEANARGATASMVVDSIEHVSAIDAVAAARGVNVPLVVEIDLAWRPVGDSLVVGVRRSPIRSVREAVLLAEAIAMHRHVRFHGVMGYEAQIAGLGDANPFTPVLNPARRLLRTRSRPHVERMRRELAEALAFHNIPARVFNGGGTGSLAWCTGESALTEVTAGSGFVNSHLFDYYTGLRLEPAIGFALQAVRRPDENVVTCQGGGYIASGEAGIDRLPRPWLPPSMTLFGPEGAGEVQTPVTLPTDWPVALGDPLFFRHAKAGELAEHFREYLFVRGHHIVERARTYRGEGECFLG